MNENKLWHQAGWLGVAITAFTIVEISLYFVYSGPPPVSNILTRILVDLPIIVGFIFFFAIIRRMAIKANPELEWIATLMFGFVLIHMALTLAANSMEGGLTIATKHNIDPTIAANATYLMYGSIGRVMTASILATSGYLIAKGRLLPRWVSRLAYLFALFSLAFVPSMYFGNDPSHFYSSNGWGTSAIGASSITYWVLFAGIAMLVKARRLARD